MQHHIQTLVKHFFRKDSLQEVTLHQLQQFTEEYPYSAAGQLLLAKKLHDTEAQNFEEEGDKLTLYFSDPVWAAWLLKEESNAGEGSYDQLFPGEALVERAAGLSFVPLTSDVQAPVAEVSPASQTDSYSKQPATTHNTSTETPKVEQPAAEHDMSQPSAATPVPVKEPTPEPAPEQTFATTGEADADVPFEPYHTIDYFASVGIKLKPEDLTKDKLGQQLKSFTDWLRTMKRIGPSPDAAVMKELDEATRQSIQRIAETSNSANEIITEAMAEVWAKQGHRDRAIAIYEKLSLLNPAKSHYFAAKIEALKAP